MDRFLSYVPVISIFGILFAVLVVLNLVRRRIRLHSLSPSFKKYLLRIPSGSLLRQLDILNEQINLYQLYVITLPLLTYSALVSYSYFVGAAPSQPVFWIAILSGIAVIAYMVVALMRLLSRRRSVRLEYEGKLAVGQQLNQLMLQGYRVYHDFPAENFNIDHVVVGSNGVFAVETKSDSNGTAGRPNQKPTVTYDGRMLTYPHASDFKTIEQAEQRADWLSEWLGKTTGEPIAARAIVALPGWVVKRTSAEGIPVVNPAQFAALFDHIKPRPLSQDMQNRIIEKIEEKSRQSDFNRPAERYHSFEGKADGIRKPILPLFRDRFRNAE